MSASLDQCPSCAARISTPRPARCEFCGSPLPLAPAPTVAERPVLHQVFSTEELEARLARASGTPPATRRGFGSVFAFFVLLALAVSCAAVFLTARAPAPANSPAVVEPPRDGR